MAALNFPSQPTQGQTFVAGSISYTYDGAKWVAGIAPGATGATGPIGGPTFNVVNSGASSYSINLSNNPTLRLMRGFTYYFSIAAAGHPFWIKTTQVTGTGSAYSSGVVNNGTDSGLIVFTVPFTAPSTLYYICQVHGTMTGTIEISDLGPTGATGATGPVANLQSISSNVVPSTSNFYDIGTSSLRWKDLYLSGNSLYLGNARISETASQVTFTNTVNNQTANIAINQLQVGLGANVVTLLTDSTGLIALRNGNISPIGGASVTVDATPPTNPLPGSLWFDTNTGRLLVRYNDNGNSVWISPIGGTGSASATSSLSTETSTTLTGSTGVVVHNYLTGGIWIHSGIAGNFTADFTNLPTAAGTIVNFTLILVQGATAYIPNAIRVDGVSQTIKWANNQVPTGRANAVDLVGFNFIRIAGAWQVIASLVSYG